MAAALVERCQFLQHSFLGPLHLCRIDAHLHHLEGANYSQLPRGRVSSHLGWLGRNGKDGFLWGKVHILTITDKQYGNARIFAGRKHERRPQNPDQLALF
jgi:CRISPR/Cas system-associated protein endoribonuclease Cas2